MVITYKQYDSANPTGSRTKVLHILEQNVPFLNANYTQNSSWFSVLQTKYQKLYIKQTL